MAQQALVLLVHGSRNPRWRRPFERLLQRVAPRFAFPVRLAFWEKEEPRLEEVVASLVSSGVRHVLIFPLFLSTGGHVGEELPLVAQELQRRFSLQIEVLPPLGEHPSFQEWMVHLLETIFDSTQPLPFWPPRRESLFFRILWYISYEYFRKVHHFQVAGLEHLPRRGPVVVVSNHPSYYDPMLICLAAKRPISFFTWYALFDVPCLGAVLPKLGAVPVDPTDPTASCNFTALRSALRCLQRGSWIGVFPEGGRTPLDEGVLLAPFQSSVFQLAYLTGSTVLPVCITGAHKAWPRYLQLPRPGKICLRFLPPISVPQKRRSEIRREDLEKLEQNIYHAIYNNLQLYYTTVSPFSPYSFL